MELLNCSYFKLLTCFFVFPRSITIETETEEVKRAHTLTFLFWLLTSGWDFEEQFSKKSHKTGKQWNFFFLNLHMVLAQTKREKVIRYTTQ